MHSKVKSHKRKTSSGKTITVKGHSRDCSDKPTMGKGSGDEYFSKASDDLYDKLDNKRKR